VQMRLLTCEEGGGTTNRLYSFSHTVGYSANSKTLIAGSKIVEREYDDRLHGIRITKLVTEMNQDLIFHSEIALGPRRGFQFSLDTVKDHDNRSDRLWGICKGSKDDADMRQYLSWRKLIE